MVLVGTIAENVTQRDFGLYGVEWHLPSCCDGLFACAFFTQVRPMCFGCVMSSAWRSRMTFSRGGRRAFDRPDKYAPISLSRDLPDLLNWRCASRYFT
jgi:hypothetical protein